MNAKIGNIMNIKILSLFACAAALLSSCAKEPVSAPAADEDTVTVTFGIETGETRASASGDTGKGKNIDLLICGVYDSKGKLLTQYADKGNPNGQIVNTKKTDEENFPMISLRLVRGQVYKIAFWSQSSRCEAYDTSDLSDIVIDYSKMKLNDDTFDVFCNTEMFTVAEDEYRTVTLRRPFAQINVGMSKSDFEDFCKASTPGFPIEKVNIKVSEAATRMNIVDNRVDGADKSKIQAVDYPYADWIKSEYLLVDLNHDGKYNDVDDKEPETFFFLAYGFILVADAVEGTSTYSAEVEVTVGLTGGGSSLEFSDDDMKKVPVQRNWSTNIILEAEPLLSAGR